MTHEWKPGSVAMVTALNRSTPYRAYFTGSTWREMDGYGAFCVDSPTSIRPLAVIDPDDRETVKRIFDMAIERGRGPLALGDALRDFADPPRIDEPGAWGVVEAACPHSAERIEWVHHPDGNWWPAWRYGQQPERTPLPDVWQDLIDPVLVREGVES